MSWEQQGGRCLDDVEQFFFSLETAIKMAYPPNEIPAKLVDAIHVFKSNAVDLVERTRKAVAPYAKHLEPFI